MPVIMSLCNYVLNTDVIALILIDQTKYGTYWKQILITHM